VIAAVRGATQLGKGSNARGEKDEMRLYLLADLPVVQVGLKLTFLSDVDARVVGEASSTGDASLALEASRAEVVVIDLAPPGMDVAATRELKLRAPEVRVLVLTNRNRLGDLLAALTAGAQGFVLKTESLEALRAAVREVWRGGEYITPSLAPLVANRRRGPVANVLDLMSAREREVLDHVAGGIPIAESARALGISRKTVETHLQRLQRKLGCHNLGDLVRFAAEHGLLPANERGFEENEPLPLAAEAS
jgi:DNA-binding NarL/FixJ family response regulator